MKWFQISHPDLYVQRWHLLSPDPTRKRKVIIADGLKDAEVKAVKDAIAEFYHSISN